MTTKAAAKTKSPKIGMDAFKTRTQANLGQKIPLYTKEGELSEHWLIVRGIDSDEFRIAQSKQTRRIAEIAALPDAEREAGIMNATLEMQASLVAAWSFDMDCTHENVKEFLQEAPQIASEVDKFATRRAFFFKRLTQS